MSTTLARRIRRIGLLSTTYKETKETYLVKDADGKESEATRIKRTPIRNREVLTDEVRAHEAGKLTTEWREKRRQRKAKAKVKK